MAKIVRLSQFIRGLIIFIALLQLVGFLTVIIFGVSTGVSRQVDLEYGVFASLFSIEFNHSWQGIALALENEHFNSSMILGAAELLPFALIYWYLFRLFSLYQQGKIFTLSNIYCLKMIGKTLWFWIGLNLLYPVLVTLVIRVSGMSDSLAIIVNLGSSELIYLLLGSIIYVIAWIMQEGLAIKEQQELVI